MPHAVLTKILPPDNVLGRKAREASDENPFTTSSYGTVARRERWGGGATLRDAVSCNSAADKDGVQISFRRCGSVYHTRPRLRAGGFKITAGTRTAWGRTARHGLGIRNEPRLPQRIGCLLARPLRLARAGAPPQPAPAIQHQHRRPGYLLHSCALEESRCAAAALAERMAQHYRRIQ